MKLLYDAHQKIKRLKLKVKQLTISRSLMRKELEIAREGLERINNHQLDGWEPESLDGWEPESAYRQLKFDAGMILCKMRYVNK